MSLLLDNNDSTSPYPVNIVCYFFKDENDRPANVYEVGNDLYIGDLTFDPFKLDVDAAPPLSLTFGLDGTSMEGFDRFKMRHNLRLLTLPERRRVKRLLFRYHGELGVQTRSELNFCLFNN